MYNCSVLNLRVMRKELLKYNVNINSEKYANIELIELFKITIARSLSSSALFLVDIFFAKYTNPYITEFFKYRPKSVKI